MKPKLSEKMPDTLPGHLFCLNQKFSRLVFSFSVSDNFDVD